MFYSNPDIISNLSSIQLPILMNFIKIFRIFWWKMLNYSVFEVTKTKFSLIHDKAMYS